MELAIWTHAIVSQLNPELLDSEGAVTKENNGEKDNRGDRKRAGNKEKSVSKKAKKS